MSTTSYESLLGGMWAPEGSEISQRLKRLQELEQLRKERSSQRVPSQETTTTSSRRRERLNMSRGENADPSAGSSTRVGYRRTMSHRSSQEDLTGEGKYGGARPKSSASNGPEEVQQSDDLFSEITSSVIGPRRRIRDNYSSDNDSSVYSGSTSTRLGSSDTEESALSTRQPGDSDSTYSTGSTYTRQPVGSDPISSTGTSYTRQRIGSNSTSGTRYGSVLDKPSYYSDRSNITRSISQPEGEEDIFADVMNSLGLNKSKYGSERRPYRRRIGNQNEELGSTDTTSYGSSYTGRNYDNIEEYNTQEGDMQQAEQQNDKTHECEVEEEEEGEEPRHFIERLRQGNNNSPNQNNLHNKRTASNDYVISAIPSVPPLKRAKAGDLDHGVDQYDDVPDLIHPMDDILAVAQDINATYGLKSPRDSKDIVFSAKSSGSKVKRTNSKRKSHKPVVKSKDKMEYSEIDNPVVNVSDLDSSVTYELVGEDDDDSEDERGKLLPVRDSLYHAGSSEWVVIDQTPGKLDRMQGFFSGREVGDDPVINRELNGSMVKAEFDLSVSEKEHDTTRNMQKETHTPKKGLMSNLKSAFETLVHFDSSDSNKSNSSGSTPEKESGTTETNQNNKSNSKGKSLQNGGKTPSKQDKKGLVGKNKALEKVKSTSNNKKNSDSETESFHTASESESDSKGKGSRRQSPASRKGASPRGNVKSTKQNVPNAVSETALSLSDKLAKLESMTQEKSRRLSVGSVGSSTGDIEGKKAVPSYMIGTSSSQMKQSRGKEDSQKPARDLVKDVRDLRKFVRENSEPNTPTATPRKKSLREDSQEETRTDKVMKEISVQTDFMDEKVTFIYVCQHCGKSNEEIVEQPKVEKKANENFVSSDEITVSKKFEKNAEKEKDSSHHYEKKKASDTKLNGRETPKSELMSSRRETQKSHHESNDSEERKDAKPKTVGASHSYMKGTASSQRKASVPEVIYKSKVTDNDSQKQSVLLSGKSSVAERAQAIDSATKAGGGKIKLSVFRTKSVERNKSSHETNAQGKTNTGNNRSKLSKSKSVEQMHMLRGKYETESAENHNSDDAIKTDTREKDSEIKDSKDMTIKTKDEQSEQNHNENNAEQQTHQVASPSVSRSQTQMLQKSPSPAVSPKPLRHNVDSRKLDLQISPLASPRSTSPSKLLVSSPRSTSPAKPVVLSTTSASPSQPLSPRSASPSKSPALSPKSTGSIKPPLSSPRAKTTDQVETFTSVDDNNSDTNVDVKGVFTTLEKNPFIKNDVKRRNSFKGQQHEESVWERSGSGSPLQRSNSTKESEQPAGRDGSLKRSNTSVGERSSLTQLSWSDSGSSGSLHGSRSNLHGSNTSLNNDSVFKRERTSSVTSQHSMLNLLSPAGAVRNTATGMIETDVDAAYQAFVETENNNNKVASEEHNEDSVNRAHLDFAKQACDLLEFEEKKRDSSSDSQKSSNPEDKATNSGVTTKAVPNASGHIIKNGQTNGKVESSSKKGKKGFLRGKLFKK